MLVGLGGQPAGCGRRITSLQRSGSGEGIATCSDRKFRMGGSPHGSAFDTGQRGDPCPGKPALPSLDPGAILAVRIPGRAATLPAGWHPGCGNPSRVLVAGVGRILGEGWRRGIWRLKGSREPEMVARRQNPSRSDGPQAVGWCRMGVFVGTITLCLECRMRSKAQLAGYLSGSDERGRGSGPKFSLSSPSRFPTKSFLCKSLLPL